MNCLTCDTEILGRRSQSKYCSNLCGEKFRIKKCKQKKRNRRTKFHPDPKVSRRFSLLKSRCKSDSIEFNLSPDDLIAPEVCPVLGIPISQADGSRKGPCPNSPSVDRINSKNGYTKGNVRVISNRANILKSDMTYEEAVLICEDIRRIRDGQLG